MSKLNYSRAEKTFDNALKSFNTNQWIDQMLQEFADLKESSLDFSASSYQKGFRQLQEKFNKLKNQMPLLYQKLNLNSEEEGLLALSPSEITPETYLKLTDLKERLDQLKQALPSFGSFQGDNEKLITKERKKHVHKRFNVREGWLPLK